MRTVRRSFRSFWRDFSSERTREQSRRGAKKALAVVSVILAAIFLLPYLCVEGLTLCVASKFESEAFPAYSDTVHTIKVYSYIPGVYAKVYYVLGDREYGIMQEYEWDDATSLWVQTRGKCMWSRYGGSAQEWFWPLYDADRLF